MQMLQIWNVGAVAQVCYLDNIPFVAIRAISDTPNGKNAKTFDENLKFASKRCSNILKEFCYRGRIFLTICMQR